MAVVAAAVAQAQGFGPSFDCRSFDLAAYKTSILQQRLERFSTLFAVCFLSSNGGDSAAEMLLTASSTGELRLYRVADLTQRWLQGQQGAPPLLAWAAHEGPVYCLTQVAAGTDVLIVSGGDDGLVKVWKLSQVMATAAATAVSSNPAQPQQPAAPQLPPCSVHKMPRADSPLGGVCLPPAVLALAYDGERTVYAGGSDGGCAAIDIVAGSSSPPSAMTTSHAAAVLCLDFSARASALASGSEDGTACVWDVRTASAARTLDVGGGMQLASRAEQLRCITSRHVPCLRWEATGSWLLCGHGSGHVSTWSLAMPSCSARQVATPFVPQAMALRPAEMLVVGTKPLLASYSACLEPLASQPLATQSAFALDVSASSGTVAVSGCHASLELLSQYGRKIGGLQFVSEED